MMYLVDAHLPTSAKEPLARDKLWPINITWSNSCLEKHQNLHKFVGSVDHLKSYPTRSARMFAIFPSKTAAANDPWYRIRRMCHKTKGAAKRGGIQLGTKNILQSPTGPRMDGRIHRRSQGPATLGSWPGSHGTAEAGEAREVRTQGRRPVRGGRRRGPEDWRAQRLRCHINPKQ